MSGTIITIGCMSNHGGVVITGDPIATVCGVPVARVGDLHACPLFYPGSSPKPHSITPIVEGPCSTNRMTLRNPSQKVALSTDRTPCGAILLPCTLCVNATNEC